MKMIPTVIFRLCTDHDGLIRPGTEYLARDGDALFEQAEWSWVPDIDDAYHFADTEPAERHRESLMREGMGHVHTMTYGSDHAASREKRRVEAGRTSDGQRPTSNAQHPTSNIQWPRLSPQEAYARMEKEGLA